MPSTAYLLDKHAHVKRLATQGEDDLVVIWHTHGKEVHRFGALKDLKCLLATQHGELLRWNHGAGFLQGLQDAHEGRAVVPSMSDITQPFNGPTYLPRRSDSESSVISDYMYRFVIRTCRHDKERSCRSETPDSAATPSVRSSEDPSTQS